MTLNLVHEIEKCGIAALGVHGRRKDERQPDRCRIEEIREVARNIKIPVIAKSVFSYLLHYFIFSGGSGDIKNYEDLLKFKADTETSSVMLARKGLQTPSVFRKEGILSMEEDIKNFLEIVSLILLNNLSLQACEYDESYTQTKYVVQRILGGEQVRYI